MLRCCLGWKDEKLIACGSDDGLLYIWHRNHNKPLKILEDKHNTSSINCVSWHPRKPEIIVTAHDDSHIIVWSTIKI